MDMTSLEAIQNMSQPAYERQVVMQSGESMGNFRLDALREAAEGAGARGGLSFQTAMINKTIKRIERNLDTVYDFSSLMIKGRVVPPVLTETREVYSQGDDSNLRLAGRTFKVESQARFSSRSPHWRDYLYVEYGDQAMPASALMPRNSEEQEVWRRAVANGWKQGVEQARFNFQTNLNRLNRDYTGMTRYHILAIKGMVTLPVVSQQNMPINATGDTMNLDETLLRITALPEFNADMSTWSPLMNEEDVLTRPGSRDDVTIPRGTTGVSP